MQYRYKILALSSSILFAFYYVYDIPAALNKHLGLSIEKNGAQRITLLYSVYALPNMILPLFFGNTCKIRSTRTTLLLCFLIFIGQSIFSLGVYLESFKIMLVGRFVYGIGGESFTVIQNKLIANQFRGRELAFSMSLSSSIARCGTVANYLVTPMLAIYWGKMLSCVFGTVLTMVGVGLCVCMVGKRERMGVIGNVGVDRNVDNSVRVVDAFDVEDENFIKRKSIIKGNLDLGDLVGVVNNRKENLNKFDNTNGLDDENLDQETEIVKNKDKNMGGNSKDESKRSNNVTNDEADLDMLQEYKKRKLTNSTDEINSNKCLTVLKNQELQIAEDKVYSAWLEEHSDCNDNIDSNFECNEDFNLESNANRDFVSNGDDIKHMSYKENKNTFEDNFIDINKHIVQNDHQSDKNKLIPKKLNLYEENINSGLSAEIINRKNKKDQQLDIEKNFNEKPDNNDIVSNKNETNSTNNNHYDVNKLNIFENNTDIDDHWSNCTLERLNITLDNVAEKKPFGKKGEVDRSFPATVRKQIELDKPVQLYIDEDILYFEPDIKGKNAYNSGFPLLVAISFMFAVVWAPFSNVATMMFQKRYGVDSVTAGRLMATQEGMSLFLVLGVGLAADYMGLKLVFVGIGGILLLVAHFFIFYTYGSPFIPVIILGFAGPLISCYWPCIVYLVSPESIGTGFAIFTCVLNIAYTFSPIMVSTLVAHDDSYDTVEFFIICVGVMAVVFVAALGMINRRMNLGLNRKSFMK